MSSVFLSYRREDSAAQTGRLHDRLAGRIGESRIFWDLDTIAPGDDFVKVIDATVAQCAVMIVVIGRWWLQVADTAGRSRISDPNDFHRIEIESALRRGDIRIIPVLVDGAKMPAENELPLEIRELARRNAIELDTRRFREDANRLADLIRKELRKRTWANYRNVFLRIASLRFFRDRPARSDATGHVITATVLACDVRGFTRISEQLGPAQHLELARAYFDVMVRLVERHGATVHYRLPGEGFLAVFGGARHRNDDMKIRLEAANAVDCALAMRSALTSLHDAHELPRLVTAVGICTGPVLVGVNSGSGPNPPEILGVAVNTAVRLASLRLESASDRVDACGVHITQDTLDLLEGRYATASLGEVQIRGTARPLQVHAVMGTAAQPASASSAKSG